MKDLLYVTFVCALVAIGFFIGEARHEVRRERRSRPICKRHTARLLGALFIEPIYPKPAHRELTAIIDCPKCIDGI